MEHRTVHLRHHIDTMLCGLLEAHVLEIIIFEIPDSIVANNNDTDFSAKIANEIPTHGWQYAYTRTRLQAFFYTHTVPHTDMHTRSHAQPHKNK